MKDRLWGGEKLKKHFNKPSETNTTGESWELSGVHGNVSVVSNGELSGKSLNELIKDYAYDLMGKSVVDRFGEEFPILIKFIDAKKDLSIQLHPNDELARERHYSFGKTEMWHIMDADPGAKLIIGFNRGMTKAEYAKSLEEDTLLDLLNYEDVAQGDTFFINTGKVHAIGEGVLLAEIQQTSDVTYRIFDFNRRDKNGNLRELHTELALDAIDYHKKNDFRVAYEKKQDTVNTMVESPYFMTNYLHLTKDLRIVDQPRASFTIFMCVEGRATIHNHIGRAMVQKGETVLVAANSKFIEVATSGAKLLEVTI